jgi:hypothetical protein
MMVAGRNLLELTARIAPARCCRRALRLSRQRPGIPHIKHGQVPDCLTIIGCWHSLHHSIEFHLLAIYTFRRRHNRRLHRWQHQPAASETFCPINPFKANSSIHPYQAG